MRIRKQASKLLGWSCLSPFPSSSSSSSAPPAASCWTPPPPPPPPQALAGAAAGELQCQLNLSPWDDMDHCHHHCTNSEDELESANDDEIGVLGNGMEAKEEEPMIMCDVSEVRKDETEEEKVMMYKEEKGSLRKRREKEMEPENIMKCKKTDGKGWHCKRDAQLPHTLCSYHLAQLRSYRTRFEEEVSDDERGCGNSRRRRKSAPVVEAGGAGTNYYYYYSVLGPWWGKRRGPVDGINGGGSTGNESRDCSESYDESEHSSPVAAGHDEPHEDHGITDGDDDEDEGEGRDGGTANSCSYTQLMEDGVKKKKKKPVKKRGRKPVKARSLKSLL